MALTPSVWEEGRKLPDPALPKLRVRTGRQYPVRFLVDVGQRNAIFVKRPLTPLTRVFAWADAFALAPEPGYDLVHSVNAVPLFTRRPYIVSFEDYLPRVPEDRPIPWLERWLRNRLLDDRCRAIIAISNYGVRQFMWQNRHFSRLDALAQKTSVVYPGVRPRRELPKKPSKSLKLLFVGADFMRKGGPAVLRAHERLRAESVPVETLIVSSLRWSPDDYIGPPCAEYVAKEKSRLAQDRIVHYPGLRNDDVLRLMEEADFFVFPTLHDTFGYVSLEAMAGGTPVIATATCAQPEVVEDGVSGFLLPFENDERIGKWAWTYRNDEPRYLEAYDRAVRTLGDRLAETLLACWQASADYERLSAGALERIRARFHRGIACAALERAYELCRD